MHQDPYTSLNPALTIEQYPDSGTEEVEQGDDREQGVSAEGLWDLLAPWGLPG